MPLIYSLVSRGTDVLCESTTTHMTGNFSTVTRVLLKKIPPNDAKLSYVYDKYIFHYMVVSGLTYLCMTDPEFNRLQAFTFLGDIKDRFLAIYGDRGKSVQAYSLNADFQKELETKMEHFNSRSENRISQVREELNQVKDVVMGNIDKVLDRGEKIELLGLIFLIIVVIILIIVMAACGIKFNSCPGSGN